MNKLGIPYFDDHKYVEKSNTGYILKSKYKIFLNPDYGIVIHSTKDCAIGIVYGDKVCITPSRLIIKGYDIALKKHSTDYYSPSNELSKAENQYQFEEQMSDNYWEIVEEANEI